MERIEEFIEALKEKGIRIWSDNEKLRYQAAKGAMDSQTLEKIKEKKVEILEFLNNKSDIEVVFKSNQAERYEPFPLTNIQNSYVIGRNSAYELGDVTCHGYIEITYQEELDKEKLEMAWNKVIAKHDMLRAIIYENGYQRVQKDVPEVKIESYDLRTSVEYVRGMSVVKAFNQTASSFKKLQEAISGYTEWVLKFSLGWQNCMPAFTTIINNIYLILVPVGILIGSNTSNFKEFSMKFIFYLLFVPAIAGVLNKIMYISESFMQIDGNVARMDEILNIPEMPETANPQKPQGEDVVFDHVSFTYTGNNEEKALESVSFAAKQGQITAIVGPSGGGKSTIANLISRFWDVTDGKITIGGVDLRDMAQNDLMRQVSFVFQDIFLFKQSILDNIRMGNRNATEEQVIAAAKAAQCHEFISKLPEGYHTVVGTKGVHLSGGERQRIAIARAIIKDSPIIVLDEATAFSDPENEYLIQKAFEKLMQNKTVIIIAHRLSTIRNADKIIVMEKGQIVESGKHDDLVAAGGRYFQMWNHYTEAINWKLNGKAV